MRVSRTAFILGLCLPPGVFLGCWRSPTPPTPVGQSTIVPSENREEIFRHLIADPIPIEISDLQGGGDQWQGHWVHLRFRAPARIIKAILAKRFVPCPYDRVQREMTDLHDTANLFDPPWQVDPERTTFYKEDPVSNDWTHNGVNIIGVDGEVVFFFGFGT